MVNRTIFCIGIIFFCSTLVKGELLSYRLAVDPELKLFHVEIKVDETENPRLVVSMPIWIPGSYFIGNYGENVLNLKAFNAHGTELRILRLHKNDWEISTNGARTILIRYDIKPSVKEFLGKAIDSTGALIQGAGVFMYINQLKNLPIRLYVNTLPDWKMGTGLPFVEKEECFLASNYDMLADSPILMGDLEFLSFSVDGVLHEIVIRGKADFDRNEFKKLIKKIVEYQISFFGEIPYNRYVFLFSLIPGYRGGGGLEHSNSCTIGLSAIRLMQDINFAANITAHEFFHLWNVKRIKSEKLNPIPYDREPRLETLWWLEGVTSYYEYLTLIRTGIWTFDEFLSHIEQEIEQLQENPDRLHTSLVDASWNIWENGYLSKSISYYNKGLLVGMLLDIIIRGLGTQQSLDDVVVYLNEIFAKNNVGFSSKSLQKTIEKISGTNFDPFFDRYIDGTVELPYEEILNLAGLDVNVGKKPVPSIGRIRIMGKKNRVFSVDVNSSAARSGVRRNDFLISVDGNAINSSNHFDNILKNKTLDDTLLIRVERAGMNLKFNVPVEPAFIVDCNIKMDSKVTEKQKRVLNSWIKNDREKIWKKK